LCAALIAPLLLVALAGAGRLALRCTLTGAVLPESCCDDADDGAPADSTDAMSAPSCCERVRADGVRAPAVVATRADERIVATAVLLQVATVVTTAPLAVPPAPLWPSARPGIPPGAPAASFLLRHSFLI